MKEISVCFVISKADIIIINEEDVIVPEKPESRKPDEIRTTILTKYQNAIRPLGKDDNRISDLFYLWRVNKDLFDFFS